MKRIITAIISMALAFGINAQPYKAEAKKEFSDLKDKDPPLKDGELSNDSIYSRRKKEIANLETMERLFRCKIQRYPFGFDETTGLKMLYIRTVDSPCEVSNEVDHVILTNDKNEIEFVVKSVLRHDNENEDGESLYGLYVVGKETEGEIEISILDFLSLTELIFQRGKSPEFVNCTKINYVVAAEPCLIPFSPISNKNREEYRRFFK